MFENMFYSTRYKIAKLIFPEIFENQEALRILFAKEKTRRYDTTRHLETLIDWFWGRSKSFQKRCKRKIFIEADNYLTNLDIYV